LYATLSGMAKKHKQYRRISSLQIEFDREEDGRWIADIPRLPGAMAYGATKREALQRVYAVALRTLADSVEEGTVPTPVSQIFSHGVAGR
jgi:predicted RNase H-like HicB family nuclease